MILDTLKNAGGYEAMHGLFPAGFEFLRRDDLAGLSDGRHEIDGDRVYAMVVRGHGSPREDGKLETHDKYIDRQFVLSGLDEMGWKPRCSCVEPVSDHDADKDVRLFRDQPDSWIAVGPGAFAIFFPEDAHMPMVGATELHKVIVKIAVT